MRRLPIRLRLTLAFALVMAVVLTATGLFLYLRFRSELDKTINQGLITRTNDVASLIRQSDGGPDRDSDLLSRQDEGFAQVLTPAGRVLDSTPSVSGPSLLDRAQLAAAKKDEVTVNSARSGASMSHRACGGRRSQQGRATWSSSWEPPWTTATDRSRACVTCS